MLLSKRTRSVGSLVSHRNSRGSVFGAISRKPFAAIAAISRSVRPGAAVAELPLVRTLSANSDRRKSNWVTMRVALQNFERQLWRPNPTDFSLVAERLDTLRVIRYL